MIASKYSFYIPKIRQCVLKHEIVFVGGTRVFQISGNYIISTRMITISVVVLVENNILFLILKILFPPVRSYIPINKRGLFIGM